jgi:hypothetical protein
MTKMEIELPDGVRLYGLHWRGTGWGAIVGCVPGHWPSQYRANFKHMMPPGTSDFHECSAGADGCISAQQAVDAACQRLMAAMKKLDDVELAAEPETQDAKLRRRARRAARKARRAAAEGTGPAAGQGPTGDPLRGAAGVTALPAGGQGRLEL